MILNNEEDELERDSSLTFFVGSAQQIENDSKMVDNSIASTLKKVSIFEFKFDNEKISAAYQLSLIKNSKRYTYLFYNNSMCDPDSVEEFSCMESPLRNSTVETGRKNE